MRLKNVLSTTTTPETERGFSMIELMVVIFVIAIMTAAIVFNFRGNKRAYASDDEAMKILSFCREAYQRALSQRQAQKLTIDRQNKLVKLTDMGTLPGGDEVLINRGVLNPDITMDQPSVGATTLSPPPAPYNYTPAAFDSSNSLDLVFLADGSVTNTANFNNSTFAPVSVTIFFSPSAGTAVNASQVAAVNSGNLMRAVTIYGPTGSAKFWRFDTDKFVWEIN